jgi:hypothetical protein
MAPTADLLRSDVASTSEAVQALIQRGASIIVLTETGTLPPDTTEALLGWVEAGGTLLRFASPNLAATTVDALLPVRLRQGERALGGSLSWEEPQPVGSFPDAGPFSRIAVPEDVRVNRQVLADPEALRDAQVWAELRDGTPLVTRPPGARAASCCSTSPRTHAGRTCRSRVPSSTCSTRSSRRPARWGGPRRGQRRSGHATRRLAVAADRGAGRHRRPRRARSRRNAGRRHPGRPPERGNAARPV